MKLIILIILVSVGYLAGSTACKAQIVQYTNQYGQPVMTAVVTGNTIVYSNQYGQPIGSAIQTPMATPTPVSTPVPIPAMLPLMPMIGIPK